MAAASAIFFGGSGFAGVSAAEYHLGNEQVHVGQAFQPQ
jgi:hypothetical protein